MVSGIVSSVLPPGRSARVVLTIGCLVYLGLVLPQLGQPYVIDEAAFPYAAQAVAETGKPIFYNGETRPADIGVWHPPLYTYSLGAFIAVAGDSVEVVRSYGVITALLAAAVLSLAVSWAAPQHRDLGQPVVVLVFLLSPLVVASSVLPDIDGTIGLLALCIGISWAARLATREAHRFDVAVTVAVLGFAFSTKLTTPFVLLPVIFCARLLGSRRVLDAVRLTSVGAAGGLAAFVAWWWPLATVSKLPFSFPFDFTLQSFTKGGADERSIGELVSRSLDTAQFTAYWLPGLWFVAAVGAIAVCGARRSRAGLLGVLFGVIGFVIVAVYNMITTPVFTFPKYWVSAVPFFAVSMAIASSVEIAVRWSRSVTAGVLATGSAVLALACSVQFRKGGADGVLRWYPTSFTVALFLIVAFALYATLRARLWVPLFATAVGVTVLAGTGQALAQRDAPFSVRYYFGERAMEEVLDVVRSMSQPSDLIIAPKDVGLLAERPFIEDAQLLNLLPPDAFGERLSIGDVALVVTRKKWDYSEAIYPAYFAEIRERCDLAYSDPNVDFEIWIPRK